MRNKIRSLPVSNSSPNLRVKQKNILTPITPKIYITSCVDFEIIPLPPTRRITRTIFRNTSASNNVQTLDNMIQELEQIDTKDLRKYVSVTQRDLENKVNHLKAITRLNVEEQSKVKERKWKNKKYIQEEEKEIRMIISRDTNKARKYDDGILNTKNIGN
ncbi:hypothetical protein SteCoe_19030 [Stentor coeruleus]|uniref:Uncharacterized protein n=1 Tax=Stentor coeruleus TaxID=5963 RepID=A0A1R2BV59_9CILI|nr:hypothetical protein SteCoe_19030 [Stentor coeruleus]